MERHLQVQPTFALLLTILVTCWCQDPNCTYYQNVNVGSTYYITSPGYPGLYGRGRACLWQASCPAGTNCVLNCTVFSLPLTQNCVGDRFLVSAAGDPTLAGADAFCGTGTPTWTSTGQNLAVGLLSTLNSPGGRFMCELKAKPAAVIQECDCGWRNSRRIVGGVETGVNEFPMMAGLVDVQLRRIKCGGTIVSTSYVATAAHCIYRQQVQNWAVLLGEHDVNKPDSAATQLIPSAAFTIHPQFNSDTLDYDIGVVRTTRPIVFSALVGPACLPFRYQQQTFAGQQVYALGWGTQELGGPTSSYLQKVQLNVVEPATCRAVLGVSITDRIVCTYADGKDACQDDSGGPLLWQDSTYGRLYHIGIISSGFQCASSQPAINSRVTQYLTWITRNTPGAVYCNR